MLFGESSHWDSLQYRFSWCFVSKGHSWCFVSSTYVCTYIVHWHTYTVLYYIQIFRCTLTCTVPYYVRMYKFFIVHWHILSLITYVQIFHCTLTYTVPYYVCTNISLYTDIYCPLLCTNISLYTDIYCPLLRMYKYFIVHWHILSLIHMYEYFIREMRAVTYWDTIMLVWQAGRCENQCYVLIMFLVWVYCLTDKFHTTSRGTTVKSMYRELLLICHCFSCQPF